MTALLEMKGLTKLFGGLAAVTELDLELEEGLILGLIGPNGAGKSTVMNMIGGTYPPSRGRITFRGRDITRWPDFKRAGLGVARVFQENILFNEFSALENVMVGFHLKKSLGLKELFKLHPGRTGYERDLLDQGRALLEQTGLAEAVDVPAGSLSHGGQRILSLAIARASNPRLLLLDETADRAQRPGSDDHDRPGQTTAGRKRHHLPGGRTQRPGGHGSVRPDRGAQFRPQDSRGPARRDFPPPPGHRGVPGRPGTPGLGRPGGVMNAGGSSLPVLLAIEELQVRYGGAEVLGGVSLSVCEGEIVTLIGSNGAGKTTLLRAVSNLKAHHAGQIIFDGRPTEKLSPQDTVKAGIGHVPQGRALFPYLPVIDNLRLGAFLRRDKRAVERDLDMIFSHFPILKERRRQLAGTLSGGEQQMLAIARSLMGRPKLLMLDEPSLALAPILVQEIGRVIVEINRAGTSILLVEQNASLALSLAQRGYVLETGRVVESGTTEKLLAGDLVRQAYLGN